MSKKVCLDAGHGGSDPGAVGHGLREKDLCLDRVLRMKQILESEYAGVEGILTRSTDRFVELSERARIANAAGADVFISDHKNAFNGSARGFESYIWNGGVGQATRNLQNTVHNKIVSSLNGYSLPNRGTKEANFSVLRNTSMSALLLEEAFIDNATDNNLMRQSAFKEAYCRAVVEGLAEHLGLSKKSGGGDEWTGQVLRRGDRGPLVGSLQSQLNNAGYNAGTVDDIYGAKTEGAVRSLQEDAGITADGIAGPQTYNALKDRQSEVGKMVVVKVDTLNYRSRPSFDSSAIAGQAKKGEAFTIVERVNVQGSSTDMYKIKSGYYITAHPNYVVVR
ncbi:N-acetylmuramoyl-L-alanine amidase [Alteribacter populi]|uniref:N-acetylmuramoyl-L-alanine amidase n=1 Tax=Alteribacter populi TaxID=2011011 RepID=UPI000BBAF144|nr:N-acetylmuramoyl-L-alanine amidase [Alteribacter populi]